MDGVDKRVAQLFTGRHFDYEIITLRVRWYVTYKLSYRDLAEMMAERQVDVAHTTIMRWVQQYMPEFVKRWRCYARSGYFIFNFLPEADSDSLPQGTVSFTVVPRAGDCE